jgi:uncharacterized membrane protein YhaH (DUF805 family)
MSFGESVMTCFRKYVDFKGRASRAEYWWFFLFAVLAYVTGGMIGVALRTNVLLLLVFLGVFLPLLSAAVRRLHDTGRSGWWYLIALIPYVGGIVLIVLLALRGNRGPNEYGSAPGVPAMPLGNVGPLPPPPPNQDSGFAR